MLYCDLSSLATYVRVYYCVGVNTCTVSLAIDEDSV